MDGQFYDPRGTGFTFRSNILPRLKRVGTIILKRVVEAHSPLILKSERAGESNDIK